MSMITKNNSFNLVYSREYNDSDETYDPYFNIYYTIFRNIPLKYLNRFNNPTFKQKIKKWNQVGGSSVKIFTNPQNFPSN